MPSKNVSSKRKTSTKKNKSMKGGWKYNKNRNSLMSRKKGGSCGCNKFFNGGGFGGNNVTGAGNVIPLNSYSAGDPSREFSNEHKGMMGGRKREVNEVAELWGMAQMTQYQIWESFRI